MRSENASSTAIDDITFSQAPCSHHGEIVTYYLKKNAVKQEYKIERHPLVYNGYSMVMEFQIERSLNNLSSGLHCVNPKPSHRKEIVSKEKDLWKDKYNLPMDCFFLNTSANVKRLYAFYDADFEKQVEYTLTNASCQCHPKVKTFAIKNARIPESSPCGSAWNLIGNSCFLFKAMKKNDLRSFYTACAELNSRVATIRSRAEAITVQSLWNMLNIRGMNFVHHIGKEWKWQWEDGSLPISDFWNNHNYNNIDKECAVISRSDLKWRGVHCSGKFAYICEELQGLYLSYCSYTELAS
ncbi:CD209 antigen-like protein D [Exaiptasia diaphana]|nr:CD209 antigen-like protein D [Exaiptasia diaphana]